MSAGVGVLLAAVILVAEVRCSGMMGRSHRERWPGRRLPQRGAKPTGALQFPVRWTVQRGLFIRRAKPTKPSVLTEL